jgi:3-isopropylmalate dehydratase small subunit
MTIIEKILAAHSGKKKVKPGDIVDVEIDVRIARDFGGAGVVQHLQINNLNIENPAKTFFTFDCNPGGSDQQYASNQQKCRIYARQNHLRVYDINAGIGTHLAMDEGLVVPGSTLVSTDSHANIIGAIGAFGQGMGDRDIAAAWSRGAVWFKVPTSVKIMLKGERKAGVSAKDIVLHLLKHFGADGLLGVSAELYCDEPSAFSLDDRITISSMATEMGAIALLFPPSDEIINYCKSKSYQEIVPFYADHNAHYVNTIEFDLQAMDPVVSLPGHPHKVAGVKEVAGRKIDSVFIGSCTNGRIEDMRVAYEILKGRKVAPGVVLKIVPATDQVWNQCLSEGYTGVFKKAGALFGNAGCAGCASGQIGQNGPGEVTISTGNRNFEGKQGKGEVYLASVPTAIASAIAGYITDEKSIPDHPAMFTAEERPEPKNPMVKNNIQQPKAMTITGKVWLIQQDNIDTDMIYHNKHLAITNIDEMGKYTFGNLKEWEDYPEKCEEGDIVVTGHNFGAGSSRQQAVDCFRALKTRAILAKSFGSIYERNAINAGFPVLTYRKLDELELKNRDRITIDFIQGRITNLRTGKSCAISRFQEIQQRIYEKGDLLAL